MSTTKPSFSDIDALLTASGGDSPFETEEIDIRGAPTLVWKRAFPSLRALFEASREFGTSDYVVYEDERLTYEGNYRAAAALAQVLVAEFGIQKGDRVAIAMRNCPEWVVAFWAGAIAGAIVVPLNAWWTGPELNFGLSDSGACVLIADGERAERLVPHLKALSLRAVLVARAEGPLPESAQSLEDILGPVADYGALGECPLPEVDIAPEDDATIFYTSGTTGQPKGALGSHRNGTTNIVSREYGTVRGLIRDGKPLPDPADSVHKAPLLSVPLFHVTGCLSTLLPVTKGGAKLVLMHHWDAERALELIEREGCTSFGGVPTMVWQVLNLPDLATRDTSSIESVAYGGAPSAPELVRRLTEAFPSILATNGYGMTETSAITTMNVGGDYERKPDSAGRVMPVGAVKIVNEDGADVPTSSDGELWIRGANVVGGYWQNPEATAAAFTDGWLHTGDIARLDEDGFVTILDRQKDMLIRGGENVYCVEVENALFDHPEILDAAVVGLPHKILGEEVGAVVQLRADSQVTTQALQDHVGAQLARFKVPVHVAFRSEPLPRNANGKLLKDELRDEMIASRSAAEER